MAKNNTPGLPENSQFLLYQTEDGKTRIEIRIEGQTVWLTQAAMADLFQTTVPNINIHLKNIYDEGEVSEKATIKDYLIVRQEGGRQIQRSLRHYNLEAIIEQELSWVKSLLLTFSRLNCLLSKINVKGRT